MREPLLVEDQYFPPVEDASPEGLLAIGGDLSMPRLLAAYRRGIFPWYNAGQPVLWWSPDPRAVLYPDRLRVSRSLRQSLRNRGYWVTFDEDFRGVVRGCASPRQYPAGTGTWITASMYDAYCELHRLGYAHSVEVWRDQRLVGGLYGVTLGRAFFGESMFSRARDASKVALVHLVRRLGKWGFSLIDCQLPSPHLESLGVEAIVRSRFLEELALAVAADDPVGSWRRGDGSGHTVR